MMRALMLSALLLSGSVLAVESSEKAQEPDVCAAASAQRLAAFDAQMKQREADKATDPALEVMPEVAPEVRMQQLAEFEIRWREETAKKTVAFRQAERDLLAQCKLDHAPSTAPSPTRSVPQGSRTSSRTEVSHANQTRLYRDKDGNVLLTNSRFGAKPVGEQFGEYEYDPVATQKMRERAEYDRKHPQYTPVYRWFCVGTDARCVLQRVRVR
jgi:hypothetical protein